jgi:hypothetical protein
MFYYAKMVYVKEAQQSKLQTFTWEYHVHHTTPAFNGTSADNMLKEQRWVTSCHSQIAGLITPF